MEKANSFTEENESSGLLSVLLIIFILFTGACQIAYNIQYELGQPVKIGTALFEMTIFSVFLTKWLTWIIIFAFSFITIGFYRRKTSDGLLLSANAGIFILYVIVVGLRLLDNSQLSWLKILLIALPIANCIISLFIYSKFNYKKKESTIPNEYKDSIVLITEPSAKLKNEPPEVQKYYRDIAADKL